MAKVIADNKAEIRRKTDGLRPTGLLLKQNRFREDQNVMTEKIRTSYLRIWHGCN